jgi:hypothetical protein
MNLIFTIRLPPGILRVRGRERIEVPRLAPGESTGSLLRIRAGSTGHYELTSTNFSYRDHRGQSHRETGFTSAITVDPAHDPAPTPQVTVGLQTAELPCGEWSNLRGRITNTGMADVSDLEVAISGQVTADQRGTSIRVEQLPAGRSADVTFFIHARQAGASVPVYLDLAYSARAQRYHVPTTHTIKVVRGPINAPSDPPEPAPSRVKILFLTANPVDTHPLRLDQEIREIQQTIRQGRARDQIDTSIRPAVRPIDIAQALVDIEPSFVHFAGHGGGRDGSFAAEDDYGNAHIIPVDGLVHLFRTVGDNVKCVIVNACNTERLARALSELVPYVIGMRQPVGDRSAILFSAGFYLALAGGKPIETAFDLGVTQIMMQPSGADQLAPLLFRRNGEADGRHPRRTRPT